MFGSGRRDLDGEELHLPLCSKHCRTHTTVQAAWGELQFEPKPQQPPQPAPQQSATNTA